MAACERQWGRGEVAIEDGARSQSVLNLHRFHLGQVASPHSVALDAGIGARGLHGEGYRGHVFWDTLFVSSALNLRFPEVVAALGLPAPAAAGRPAGRRRRGLRRGPVPLAERQRRAGRDARPPVQPALGALDPRPLAPPAPRRPGRGLRGVAALAGHRGLDFLAGPGAELFLEVARYFAAKCRWDPDLGRYRITGVMGPDEFHDGYPWSSEPGVSDNAYTNVLCAWVLWRAGELVELLAAEHRTEVVDQLGVTGPEVARWEEISRSLHVPFHDGVISQFAGYERLEPIDLAACRERFGNIGRLDLLLEAEGDSVRRYQVAKQADVLMLFYLFSAGELRVVLERLGYVLAPETIRATLDYYAARVTHGSTLSTVVHAWVLARANRAASWGYFADALEGDVADLQGGTTREGIHIGAMAGTLDIVQRCYTGLEVRGEALWLDPALPAELAALHVDLWFRGHRLGIDVDHHRLRVAALPGRVHPVTLMLSGEPVSLAPGQSVESVLDGR